MAALTGQQAGMAALVQQAARDPTLFAAQLALADEELMARLDPHSRQRVHDILAGGMTAHPEPSVAPPAATVSGAFELAQGPPVHATALPLPTTLLYISQCVCPTR